MMRENHHNVTWMKYEKRLAQRLLPPNVVRWWLIKGRTHPLCHINLWPCGHMGPRDKLKTKYLLLRKAYRFHTWQGGDLWWGKLTQNLRWSSDHVITGGHVTNWKRNISSSVRSMTATHDISVAYGKRSLPSLQRFFRAQVMVFCPWENARIIFGY